MPKNPSQYRKLALERFGLTEAPSSHSGMKPGAPIADEPEQPDAEPRTVPTGAAPVNTQVKSEPSAKEDEYTKDLVKLAKPTPNVNAKTKLSALIAKSLGQDVKTEGVVTENVCPKCGRESKPWPLHRPNVCSPKHWVYCLDHPGQQKKKGVKNEAIIKEAGNYQRYEVNLHNFDSESNHDKVWQGVVEAGRGKNRGEFEFHRRWGRRGTRLSDMVEVFDTFDKAKYACEKLVQRKVAKGYQRTSGLQEAIPALSHASDRLHTEQPKGALTSKETKIIDVKEQEIVAFSKKAFARKPLAQAQRLIAKRLEGFGIENRNSGRIADVLTRLLHQNKTPKTQIIQKATPKIINHALGGVSAQGNPGAGGGWIG